MDWASKKLDWAKENPLFWANLVLVFALLIVAFVWPSPNGGDFRLRVLGMLLQLVGVLTVWWDLTATAREFGKDGMLRRTWKWLKRGLFREQHTLQASGASAATFGSHIRAKVRHAIDASLPISERVGALEVVIAEIDRDLDHAYQEIGARAGTLEEKIKAEAAERYKAVAEVKGVLERATAGNYSTLVFGAFWLAVGVIVATCAPEIAKIAAGQWAAVRASL